MDYAPADATFDMHSPCHLAFVLMNRLKSTRCGQTIHVPLRRQTRQSRRFEKGVLKIFKISVTNGCDGERFHQVSINLYFAPAYGFLRNLMNPLGFQPTGSSHF